MTQKADALRAWATTPERATLLGLIGAGIVGLAAGLDATALPGPIAAAVFILLVVAATIPLIVANFQAFVVMWVAVALTQNVVAGLWLHAGASGGFVWTEAKTIAAGVLVLAYLPAMWRYLRADRWLAIVVFAYVAVLLGALRSTEPEAFAYVRNFGLPLALLVAAFAARRAITAAQLAPFVYRLAATVIGYLALGNAIESLVGSSRWRSWLNADELDSVSALSQTTPFFGIKISRVGGFLLEPITTGYLVTGAVIAAGVAFAACSAERPDRSVHAGRLTPILSRVLHPAVVMVLGVAVIISAGTKSSLLALVVAAMVFALTGWLGRLRAHVIAPLGWVLSLASVVAYMVTVKPDVLKYGLSHPLRLIGGDSTTFHWAGLVLGVRESVSPPWGHGLGDGGNFYYNFHPDEPKYPGLWLGKGAESGIGVLAYQLGIVGLVLFLGAVAMLAQRWGAGAAVLLTAWSSGAFFGESYFGPLVAWVYVLPAALLAIERRDDAADPVMAVGRAWVTWLTSNVARVVRR